MWPRVVGVTAYFEIPEGAPRPPRIGGFSKVDVDRIVALEPDLVIAFSDVQAAVVGELMRRGLPVLGTNPRTLGEIGAALRLMARVMDRAETGERLVAAFERHVAPVAVRVGPPRTYFEEWDEPHVAGIGWIGELVERAGGVDVFSHRRVRRAAKERQVTDAEVIEADPEIIVLSWCGKPSSADEVRRRPGWEVISAVRRGAIHVVPPEDILQPGYRLVHGFDRLREIVARTEF